jgi:hypothetical protein
MENLMADETIDATNGPERTSAIARDLREYARAGVDPVYAAKLLAVAVELDAFAARRERVHGDVRD